MSDKKNPNTVQHNDPLHGVKLVDILERLVDEYGWEELGTRINIRCLTMTLLLNPVLRF